MDTIKPNEQTELGMPESDVKEVSIDVPETGTGRRRRRRTARRRQGDAEEDDIGGSSSTHVDVAKESGVHQATIPQTMTVAPAATATAAVKKPVTPPVVVLAPAKRKTRIMLVAKGKEKDKHKEKTLARKTFKAKRVRVTIDNTAKTVKRRRQVLQTVDTMSADQLREAAVMAKLSRRDSVAKVPEALLRQMLKDYKMMKGMLV